MKVESELTEEDLSCPILQVAFVKHLLSTCPKGASSLKEMMNTDEARQASVIKTVAVFLDRYENLWEKFKFYDDKWKSVGYRVVRIPNFNPNKTSDSNSNTTTNTDENDGYKKGGKNKN